MTNAITISGQDYAAKPVRQYVMQFLRSVFSPDGKGGQLLQMEIDICAPLLEVIAEDVCPSLDLIGYNRALQKYYWRGETAEMIELCGEVSRLFHAGEIERLTQAKTPDMELIAANRANLEEILYHLGQLREEVGQGGGARAIALEPQNDPVEGEEGTDEGMVAPEMEAMRAQIEALQAQLNERESILNSLGELASAVDGANFGATTAIDG